MIDVQLLSEPLSVEYCRQYVMSPDAGALTDFVGIVRRHTRGKKVLRLDFEAYEPLALFEMRQIAEQAIAQFGVLRIGIHHRIGSLGIGETAVVIAVSAAHRKEAFAACQFCIDTLKKTVPIWKKEIFEDGEVWVAAHP